MIGPPRIGLRVTRTPLPAPRREGENSLAPAAEAVTGGTSPVIALMSLDIGPETSV